MEIEPQWEPGPDIRVVDAEIYQDKWIAQANTSVETRCPGCGTRSQRRHSAYVRRLQDLPVQGTSVELQVSVTQWRCGNGSCERKTFVDQADQCFIPAPEKHAVLPSSQGRSDMLRVGALLNA